MAVVDAAASAPEDRGSPGPAAPEPDPSTDAPRPGGPTTDQSTADEPARRGAPASAAPVAAVAAALFALIAARPLADNSLLTHLATGRLIVESGVPTTNPFLYTSTDFPVPSWWWSILLAVADGLGGAGRDPADGRRVRRGAGCAPRAPRAVRRSDSWPGWPVPRTLRGRTARPARRGRPRRARRGVRAAVPERPTPPRRVRAARRGAGGARRAPLAVVARRGLRHLGERPRHVGLRAGGPRGVRRSQLRSTSAASGATTFGRSSPGWSGLVAGAALYPERFALIVLADPAVR